MARCDCTGNTCGCRIQAGAGIAVIGSGTKVDPFIVSRDASSDSINTQIFGDTTTTVKITKLGSGTTVDPTIIQADVILTSPNGAHWTLAVSNSGVLSAVAL
jgi:hypothetical protein